MSTIHTRFDLICSANKDADRELCRAELLQVPLPGETINLKGNPYVVVDRGWAVENTTAGNSISILDPHAKQYAYVRVSRLYKFKDRFSDLDAK